MYSWVLIKLRRFTKTQTIGIFRETQQTLLDFRVQTQSRDNYAHHRSYFGFVTPIVVHHRPSVRIIGYWAIYRRRLRRPSRRMPCDLSRLIKGLMGRELRLLMHRARRLRTLFHSSQHGWQSHRTPDTGDLSRSCASYKRVETTSRFHEKFASKLINLSTHRGSTHRETCKLMRSCVGASMQNSTRAFQNGVTIKFISHVITLWINFE